jgi:hypothetical protein
VNKIEIYQGGGLLYTLENEAVSIHTNEILTSGIGSFNFSLPTKKNGDYLYNNINVNDTVKIYMGYDSVGATPLSVGKICKISAPLTLDSGYVRVFEGKNQGEILKRRLKMAKMWKTTGASTIVTALANDLSLGTGQIVSDSTAINLFVDAESYFDVLKRISDYWYDADTQIKKDFYVDVDNNLVWKARPLRQSPNVETLTIGENIINYDVIRDVEPVKNKIKVYGQKNVLLPTDKDSWTEDSTTGWTCYNDGVAGVVSTDETTKKVGSKSIKFHFTGVSNWSTLRKTFDAIEILTQGGFSNLHFYWTCGVGNNIYLKLLAPDSSNYYQTGIVSSCAANVWTDEQIIDLSTAITSITGSPTLNNVQALWFCSSLAGTFDFWVDGLYFSKRRNIGTAEDATSQTNYGQRDLIVTDDALTTDADCTSRASTLLYQLKNPPTRIDVEIIGNSNVKIGDRLSMTIPAEGISATNFDVVSVQHDFSLKGWTTKASMVNSGDVRQLPCGTVHELIQKHLETQKEIARGIQFVK